MGAWELSGLRKTFLLIPILALMLVIACRLIIGSVGASYDMVVRDESFCGVPLDANDISVLPPDIASVEDVSKDDEGYPVIRFRSEHPGAGQVLINTAYSGASFELKVTEDGLLVVDGINFSGWQSIGLSVAAVFALAAILCIRASRILFKRSWYGYEMVTYVGGALFCLVETVSYLLATMSETFLDFAFEVTAMADNFVALTFLPMLIAAALVCISNVFLIHYEGLRPVNLLGIAASLIWGLTNLILLILTTVASNTLDTDVFWFATVLDSVLAIAVALGETLLVSTCICSWLASRHVPSRPRDCIIVLGCGIFADGTPTPLLKGRIEAALSFADRQQEEGHSRPALVMSGGQGPDEIVSEAQSMAAYVHATRPDLSPVLTENRSTSTAENMSMSAEVISTELPYARLFAFATTNYHVFRAYVCAHDAGLNAEGIASPTKPYFWPNAFLREAAGLVVSRAPQIAFTLIVVGSLYFAAEYALLIA